MLGADHRGGLNLLTQLRAQGITAPVVLITAFADVERLKLALNQGAAHLLEKPFRAAELVLVIESLLQRQKPALAPEHVLRSVALTEKELTVARYLLDGLSSTEIAERELNSAKTIRQHVSRIYAKFGVNSRADFFRLVYSGSAPGALRSRASGSSLLEEDDAAEGHGVARGLAAVPVSGEQVVVLGRQRQAVGQGIEERRRDHGIPLDERVGVTFRLVEVAHAPAHARAELRARDLIRQLRKPAVGGPPLDRVAIQGRASGSEADLRGADALSVVAIGERSETYHA